MHWATGADAIDPAILFRLKNMHLLEVLKNELLCLP